MQRAVRIFGVLVILSCVGCGTGPRSIFDRAIQSKVELTDALHFITSEESAEKLFQPMWERFTKNQTDLELELIAWGRLGETGNLARELQRIAEDSSLQRDRKIDEAKQKAKGKEGDRAKILEYCVAKSVYDVRRASAESRYKREQARIQNIVAAYRAAKLPSPFLDQAIAEMQRYREPSFEAGEISLGLLGLFEPKEVAEVEKEIRQAASSLKIDTVEPTYTIIRTNP
jgi:hypothetical protein